MKHLHWALLASAAAIVTAGAASAADLPTRKAAPSAEYVRICTVGGKTGFVLPGSDTCLKISGYARADFGFGNLKNEYKLGLAPVETAASLTKALPKFRDAIGESVRAIVGFEAVSNTPYGPLYGSVQAQFNNAWGFDPFGATKLLNAYVSWAGLTAGRHASFYDFLNSGPAWKDFISPDHTSTPISLFAYTASFGEGFSATISFEQPAVVNKFGTVCAGGNNNGGDGSPTCAGGLGYGARSPDIIASLDAKQSWGRAHLAGVLHKVDDFALPGGPGFNDYNKWGYGLIGGVEFNLSSMGPSDKVALQGVWTKAATGYSGLMSPATTSGDTGLNINGNGVIYGFGDAFYNPATNSWSTPTAWSMAAQATHAFSPQFSISPEISYGHIKYSNGGGASAPLSAQASSWLGGAVFSWDPVTNLDFSFDALYQHSHFAQPAAWVGPGWVSKADGFDGRLRVKRSF